jgi:hypothetical protein
MLALPKLLTDGVTCPASTTSISYILASLVDDLRWLVSYSIKARFDMRRRNTDGASITTTSVASVHLNCLTGHIH